MNGAVGTGDWRTWPRKGDHIDAPADSPMEQRLAAMWALTCEAYGSIRRTRRRCAGTSSGRARCETSKEGLI